MENRQYEPFPLRPLRMRGIFGIAWQTYKRGFFSALLLSFVLIEIAALLSALPMLSAIKELFVQIAEMGDSLNDETAIQLVLSVFGAMGSMALLSLLSTFLLAPMYQGTIHAEFGRRMRGQVSSVGQLFKSCGKGLSRYYSTYLCDILAQMGVNMAVSIVCSVVSSVLLIGTAFSAINTMQSGNPTGFIVILVLLVFFAVFVGVVGAMFLSFIYPVAIHENKRNFKAVGRSFKLAGKNFGRVLGATLLFALLAMGVSLVGTLPGLGMLAANIAPVIESGDVTALLPSVYVMIAGAFLAELLILPYNSAFFHALYYDVASREEEKAFDYTAPIPQDAVPAQAAPVEETQPVELPEAAPAAEPEAEPASSDEEPQA